jgi:hypothetical protein
LQRDPSSYRDPDGYIFYVNDNVYRQVLNKQAPILQPVYNTFFQAALKKGLLVPFEKSGDTLLQLTRLPMVSYPYEWGFEQLKEAALTTLDIGLLALEHGLSLKDATAFNLQQYEGRMIFIDHTSFETSDNKLPWRPYSQFCRHFLAPLLVTSRTGRNANKSFLINLDGLDLGEAGAALRVSDKFHPSIIIHIYLHHFLTKKLQDTRREKNIKSTRTGNQKIYLRHLRDVVSKISPPRYNTEWHRYYGNTNYNDESFYEKEKFVREIMLSGNYACAWDIGGNNGHFSRTIAERALTVISMDIDHAAIDLNYLKNRQEGKRNIYPLVMDLANPSPALGFGNRERTTIEHRSKPDIMFALALIHHLAVTYNIPFELAARHLREKNAELVIEFVDREDSQFRKLLRSRGDMCDSYNKENFEKSFNEEFEIRKKYHVPNSHRTLYHFVPKI